MPGLLKRQALALPNLLTYARIAAIPAVLTFLAYESRLNSFFAAMIFSLASLTDIVDGYLARKYQLTSVLGKFLDPLADKLLVASALIMLLPLGRIDAWIVIVIIAREMAITGLRSIASSEGLVIAARDLGKRKTSFQMVGIVFLMAHYDYEIDWLVLAGRVSFHRVGYVLVLISLVFSLWSAFDYFRSFFAAALGDAQKKAKLKADGAQG